MSDNTIKKARYNRAHQAKARSSARSYKTEVENLLLLIAWQAAELSEGQASRAIGCDRISLRMMRDGAIAQGVKLFGELK